MTDTPTAPSRYVVPVETVKWAIDVLAAHRIHPWFPAYLLVRQLTMRAASEPFPLPGPPTGVQPRWRDFFDTYLKVLEGPPNKPYYKPFVADQVSDKRLYWQGTNLSGSYSPSSFRDKDAAPFTVDERKRYHLRDDHAAAALEHLLNGVPVQAHALAAFFLRDRAVVSQDGTDPGGDTLVLLLRRELVFPDADPDWASLFNDSAPPNCPPMLVAAHEVDTVIANGEPA